MAQFYYLLMWVCNSVYDVHLKLRTKISRKNIQLIYAHRWIVIISSKVLLLFFCFAYDRVSFINTKSVLLNQSKEHYIINSLYHFTHFINNSRFRKLHSNRSRMSVCALCSEHLIYQIVTYLHFPFTILVAPNRFYRTMKRTQQNSQ